MTGDRFHVGGANDWADRERRIVTVDGVEVGGFAVGGEFFALRNQCAHEGGPVCTGLLQRQEAAEFVEPGERLRERLIDDLAIACPWHGWEYDLRTGVHLGDADYAIQTYDVVEEDGELYLEL